MRTKCSPKEMMTQVYTNGSKIYVWTNIRTKNYILPCTCWSPIKKIHLYNLAECLLPAGPSLFQSEKGSIESFISATLKQYNYVIFKMMYFK